jgi:hypothetical protein
MNCAMIADGITGAIKLLHYGGFADRDQALGTRAMTSLARRPFCVGYAKVCTITGPAIAVAGPANRGVRLCSIHASTRLFDSSAPV